MQRQLETVKTPPFPELLDRGAGAGSRRHPEAKRSLLLVIGSQSSYWSLTLFMIDISEIKVLFHHQASKKMVDTLDLFHCITLSFHFADEPFD